MSRGRPGAHEQGYDQDAVGHLGHDEIDEVGLLKRRAALFFHEFSMNTSSTRVDEKALLNEHDPGEERLFVCLKPLAAAVAAVVPL